jgi:penicillin amidase
MKNLILRKAWPRTNGEIRGLPLRGKVEVIRDRWGIPHIYAESMRDLFIAQGFVHAQDRLWQMESLRRLSEGRLSEIAGEQTLMLDYFCRMIGMPGMKRQIFEAATEEHGLLQAYADGVNAYLAARGKDLPLEFRSMGFVPEPWSAVDGVSFTPFVSWSMLAAPYAERLLALARGSSLSLREWNDMFPCHPGANLPTDPYFDRLARMRIGSLHPAATAFHVGLSGKYAATSLISSLLAAAAPGAGSNNWTFAKGADGLPLLANDPHMGVSLPAVWYFCHLCVPGKINAAGTSIAGAPGVDLGRNEHVAWGVTNVMLDAVDVLMLGVDPKNPTRYRRAGGEHEMRREVILIRLPKGKSVSLPLYRTDLGPVITTVEEGVEAVAVLKWYGTLPEGMLQDRTFGGFLAIMKARGAAEVLDAGKTWRYLSMNLVAADDGGHIGWHPTGAVPLRNGYTGRLPSDGTAGNDWVGFVPYDSLPSLMDPQEGWIGTANYRPLGPETGRPLSYSWCSPYRHQRIAKALAGMHSPGVEDFRRLQMDVHSLQAERILPALLAFPFSNRGAAEAARILAEWDREITVESPGAAVYEVFIAQLERELLEGALGDDLVLYLNARLYGIVDEILERPDSPFWGGGISGERPSPVSKLEKALVRTMEFCAGRMGRDPRKWSWGRLHRHVFRHPGATSAITRMLLNPRPRPASGDMNTLNVSWCMPALDTYEVTTVPSMRMITSLADQDSLRIVGPLGQSGQPGHPHYEDLTPLWLRGEQVPIPLTRPAVEKIARDRLTLVP